MLPTFIVIGAAKGGTTSLFYYLRQHADIYLAPTKETNFYWAEGAARGRRDPRTLANTRAASRGRAARPRSARSRRSTLNSRDRGRPDSRDLPA